MFGCAGPPVQEMSDARQAIAAAQEAGADTKATDLYIEARQLLNEAERALRDRTYYAAKRAASDAKAKALEAQRASKPDAETRQEQP